MNADLLASRFIEQVRVAYMLEKGARANELAGKYVPLRDSQGLHPASYVTGQYNELYDVLCVALGIGLEEAREQLLPNHLELREAARADADEEFLEDRFLDRMR